MYLFAAVAPLLFLQYNTASPTQEVPLQQGKWVLRETVERGTGFGGISASLLSDDGAWRLVVRCDFSYESDISIQFLRAQTGNSITALPVTLTRMDRSEEIPLIWEATYAGVFARDGMTDSDATLAAATLQDYVGPLRIEARDRAGRRIRATFDAAEGHAAIRRATTRCYDS